MIELRSNDGRIDLTVSDDGRGMPASIEGEAIGIEGMRERALLVGGSLEVEPSDGDGTTIRLSVPLEPS